MKNTIIYFAIVILLTSCVSDDHFGLSPYGRIKAIEISNQASQATIDNENLTVEVEFPGGIDLSELTIRTLTLSSFASADKEVGSTIDLTQQAQIKVSAEDGSVTTWTVEPFVASSTPQLDNGDLNLWYKTSNDGYYQPGADAASTIWGTGNPGTQILGLLASTPLEIASNNYAAKLETLDNGRAAAAFGTPISAGSIFIGTFDEDKISPSDPKAAIDFGNPFSGRPSQLKFTYQYIPGEVNKDKNGNVLPDGDQCDIYAYLEIRSANTTARLATAWFRSGDVQNDLIEKSIDFTYGTLDSTFPDFMKPENGVYVSADSASFMFPTHITFVASSSFDGANFAGAIGSTLVIDDIEMIYE